MTGNSLIRNALLDGQSIQQQGDKCCINVGRGELILEKHTTGDWHLAHCQVSDQDLIPALVLALEHRLDIRCIYLGDSVYSPLLDFVYVSQQGQRFIWRETLMQLPELWLSQRRCALPHKQVLAPNGYHPMRPKPQKGPLYRRYIPELESTLSLVGLDVDQHARLFSKWQNSPRVAAFWEQTGSLDEHTAYLEEQVANDKNQLLMVCLNEQPFAYIEAYWTKEDRISPYYEAGDYDRGIHMLVGEQEHRGAHKVAAWLPSVCHFLYLSDPRTQKIVSEPRADNSKMIGYLHTYGFAQLKQFHFPHKRAALMCQLRDTFFSDCF
ncbi:GNAT family N-acetyltransferase [Vibrio ostreicida]|uniref:GNAT family N-acetyltransferase n=1 Tax=Vibrio ostreicida TaxID=526588 RepID=A0ABT8BS57_9VIBR|nr:GNAT family N-acetyltransferase [Vibrio ostreicida]MDN3609930.1 GNAT family N-acetyltransferase [Vibrio ostreicida]NPD10360.1 acetyltransferase [Vibrio ostreicida]